MRFAIVLSVTAISTFALAMMGEASGLTSIISIARFRCREIASIYHLDGVSIVVVLGSVAVPILLSRFLIYRANHTKLVGVHDWNELVRFYATWVALSLLVPVILVRLYKYSQMTCDDLRLAGETTTIGSYAAVYSFLLSIVGTLLSDLLRFRLRKN
jgi:hypothetical protein